MTAVALPTAPYPVQNKISYVDYGGVLTPQWGGPEQRIVRLGSRFQCAFTWLSMGMPFAEAFAAALLTARATGSTVIAAFPQPKVGAATAGAGAEVNGANQTGLSLVAKLLGTGTIPAGAFFSFVGPSGRNYLHMVTGATAIVSNAATLPIAPLIRESPAANAALNFVTPQIEGFTQGNSEDWTLDRMAWSTFGLTIKEVQ